ncbi:MAG: acetyl-CoA carboxylase carboxyl transferase subunit beta, partial [Alkalinema sp. CAN_BIN05]|nr:acetyl-CoA carboxylase carboxyl transferase subunit beta [Alkalinema sp. CAN_BIN05]
MSLFDWFANRRKESPEPSQPDREREIADGLWTKCDSCGALTYT